MPVIDLEKCTLCLKCVRDCPANAITIKTGTIADTCIHCGHCVAICPEMAVNPDVGDVIPLAGHSVTAENFRHLTAGIRSCRSYLAKEVPDEVLKGLVDNIGNYPSASNARPMHLTIVRTPGKVKLLNDLTEESLVRMFSFVTSPFVSPVLRLLAPSLDGKKLRRYKDSFVEKKKNNDSMICHHAPAVILFHGPVTRTGMLEADANIWATYTSVYANTMGLATCFNGFIVQAMRKNGKQNVKFGVPADHRVYASLLVGYSKVKYKNEASRMGPEVNFV
jgi:NAD-dependent dihydropyrimidine dehydrogenase PreA subunit/nitroreductase